MEKEKKILVIGDEVIDWIDIPTKPQLYPESGKNRHSSNWRLTPGTRRVGIGGGTYLIVDILKEICSGKDVVIGPTFNQDKIPDRDSCIQSYMRIEEYDSVKKNEEKTYWRVKEFLGYDGPQDPQPSHITIHEADHFKTIIIDDAANGIRNSKKSNTLLGKVRHPDIIVYKLARPLNAEPISRNQPGLWEKVLQKRVDKKCELVVLLDVNDLRNEGAAISHGLSWERFASDVVHFFTYTNHILRFGEDTFHGWIIVKAGLEGAVIIPPGFKTLSRPAGKSPILVYNPAKGEDDSLDKYRGKGKMTGYFSVFAAAVGYCLHTSGAFSTDCLIQAVKAGLHASGYLLQCGFLYDENTIGVKYPVKEISKEINSDASGVFQHTEIPAIRENYSINKKAWSIVETLKMRGIVDMAEKLVRQDDEKANIPIPCAKFGKLTTYDPSEIENFRTVKRLVREYLEAGVLDRPLSIGVFGKPGSGKSFGVKEVVKSLLPADTRIMTFNLSEFQTVAELARSFHIVHDLTRDGTMPLIFFDEFDCSLNKEKCGWLKYFLAPMQDGKFNDGNDLHPIGRAIFVFAGGTKGSYKDFSDQEYEPDKWFAQAKGPDFLSRLRGYVDILGVDSAHNKDFICLIRRATILRANIISRAKTLGIQGHWLLNEKKEIIIEDAVLQALLKIPAYKNGARTLAAIIESCQLSLSKGLTKASLPPDNILAMHVDVKRFNELLYAKNFRDKVFLPARETMARIVHEFYRQANKGEKNDIPWEQLSVYDQQQNLYQVDSYADLLQSAGFDVELSDYATSSTTSIEVINKLAVAEHERWMRDKISQGFKYGPEKSTEHFTHPDIVPWDELDPKDQAKDVEAVKRIPELLNITGLSIVNK